MNFKPTEDRILVKEVAQETTSPGGIVLPESAQDKHVKHGEVVAVGPGRLNDRTGGRFDMAIKVGDKVVFSVRSGTPVKVTGIEYLLMTEFEVLGILS